MKNNLEEFAMRITKWVGCIWSLVVHTLIFIFFFVLIYLGYDAEKVMLVLTTLVSLEAIYLALFIQMTVNKNTQSIENIEEDVDEMQEDIDEIQEDIEEIEKDVDEIQEDIEDIEEDVEEISKDVDEIQEDIEELNEEEENKK